MSGRSRPVESAKRLWLARIAAVRYEREVRRALAFLGFATCLLLCEASEASEPPIAGEPLRVLVPDRDNLQYMSFWVAKAAGYFAEEGIAIDLVVPEASAQARAFFEEHKADVAVLPPPIYLSLIAAKVPLVLVANLLANDPIELVVRRSILDQRRLSVDRPLHDRLVGLRGLRIGIAPHPPTRLRALFASQGLDADAVVTLVILHGKEQNAAFHEGRVDALYAHTPYLERAIVHDDAVVLVDQSRGEVKELANRQIHALAVTPAFLATRRDRVVASVRAIARAEALIHTSQSSAVDALAREFPTRERLELETIVRLYEPAIPPGPDVRAADIPPAVTLFPAGMTKPDLSGIDLERHVASEIAVEAAKPVGTRARWAIVAFVALAILGAVFASLRRAKRPVRVTRGS